MDVPAWLVQRLDGLEARIAALEGPRDLVLVMIIDGVRYMERKALVEAKCDGCAFDPPEVEKCAIAAGEARKAFGQGCGSRDVIYVEVRP